MSEIVFGSLGVAVAVGATGVSLIQRIYQQAGVSLRPKGVQGLGDVNELFAAWHRRLLRTLQALAPPEPLAPIAQARALQQTLAQVPVLAEVVTHLEPQRLTIAQMALKEVETAQIRGDPVKAMEHAQVAQRHFEEAIFLCYERLALAQQQVVCRSIAETLQEMGYQVEQSERGLYSALWATRGAESIALVLERDGSFQMDTLGFQGLRCRQERAALLARLKEKGLHMQVRQSVLHGDRYGGQLLKRALATARRRHIPVPEALLQAASMAHDQDDLRRRQQVVWGQQRLHR